MNDLISKFEYGKAIGLKIEMIRAKIDNCRNHVFAQNVMDNWESEIKGLYDALIILDDAPIVDAVEVVHGHWRNNSDDIAECSICGYHPQYDPIIDDIYHSNYCPNCGAKMDEVSE